MSPSIFKTGAVLLTCMGFASATQQYTLASTDLYTGTGFFDMFDFITDVDPNQGFVSYQSKAVAESSSLGGPLIKTFSNGSNFMGVDHWNKYAASAGRPSVRIETKSTYQYGLFVADLAHMPASVCGTWPAFWTVSHENWPSQGEIDILENISENNQSLVTLHSTDGCQVVGNQLGSQQTGTQNSYNCNDYATSSNYGSQSNYQGCSATDNDPHSYGSAFNANSGGIYAMEWTSQSIQIWNFGPKNIPSDLTAGTPNTALWGKPVFTTARGSCNIDTHFKDHNVVFNTDFCGSYAGLDYFWQQTSCYDPVKYPTCNSYVAANPAKYADAYWTINSLKVYKKTNVVSTSSSSTHSSTATTSKTSTSTSKSSTNTTTSTSSTSSLTSSTASPTSSTISTSSTSTSTLTSSTTTTSSSTSNTPTPSSTTSLSSTSTSIGPSTAVPTSSTSSVDTTSSGSSAAAASSSSSTSSADTTWSGSSTAAASSSSSTSSADPTRSLSSSSTETTSTSRVPYTTSTVYTTNIYTITSCAPTITDCPARIGSVTTETIALYTTVCPVTATETSGPSKSPYSPPPPPKSTTSTVYTTKVYTITSCAPTVTDCPAKIGKLTTEVISLYTTVCPYTAVVTHPAYPIVPSSLIVSPATGSTVVVMKTETVVPVPWKSASSMISIGTNPAASAGWTSSTGATAKASSSPIVTANGANELRASGALALVFAALAMLV